MTAAAVAPPSIVDARDARLRDALRLLDAARLQYYAAQEEVARAQRALDDAILARAGYRRGTGTAAGPA